MLQVPGIVPAQRWKVSEQAGDAPEHGYLAIYELDDRPPGETVAALMEAAPTMCMSPALGDAKMLLFEPLTDRVLEIDRTTS